MNSLFIISFGKIGIGIALIYVILKVKFKSNSSPDLFYNKNKTSLYHLHILGAKIALITAVIHGVLETGKSNWKDVTGWLSVAVLVALTGIGAMFSIKYKSTPMTLEQDQQWKSYRIAKWLLTLCLIVLLALHTLILL